MAEKKDQKSRVESLKQTLKWLFDITDAINQNRNDSELLATFEGILRRDLAIGKVMILKTSGKWECKLNNGFSPQLVDEIMKPAVKARLMELRNWEFARSAVPLEGVDIIIPAINSDVPIGFVFIGNIEEEETGLSPVVKNLNFMQTISRIIIVAMENRRLTEESLRQAAFRKELELAARMQKMLIPNNAVMPDIPAIKMNGFYFPHYEVGGDYYDCIRLSGTKTGFCIADVSGKGISAAILMSNFQASFRALFTEEITLETLVRKLNSIVIVNAEGEKFITFFVARFDHTTGVLEYVNAAHNAPVLYNTRTGEVTHISASCVGVGMLDEIPVVRPGSMQIAEYTKIVLYTDGLSELKDDTGNDIGTRLIVKHISNNEPVEVNMKAMISELQLPGNPSTFDDISLLAADLRKS